MAMSADATSADAAEPPAPRASSAWRVRAGTAWQATRAWSLALPIERLAWAAIAMGIVLRLASPWLMDIRADGNTYAAMGWAWAKSGTLTMPWGDVTTWGPLPPSPSNHYPPMWPVVLGVVYKVFGWGLWQTKITGVAASLAALASVWWTTRDLYGQRTAAITTALLSLEPHLLWATGTGFSENFVLILFAATMWSILKSLQDDRWVVLAGLFAGLAYLTRASIGSFFIVAGVGGFVWRFAYRRWRLFTNVWYMLAIVIFGILVLSWATRNVLLFGYQETTLAFGSWSWTFDKPLWETSSYTRFVQGRAFSEPANWRHALLMKTPFFAVFLAWWIGPMLPEAWRGLKRAREEHTSALIMSILLITVIAWIITSMFWVFEKTSLYWFDNHRYIVIALLPLAWWLLREVDWSSPSSRVRIALLLASLMFASAAVVVAPPRYADTTAAIALEPLLQPGDTIGVDRGTNKYSFYAYLSHPDDVEIYGWAADERWPDFLVTLKTATRYPDNYTRLGTFEQPYWTGGVVRAALYAHDDVVGERNLTAIKTPAGR